MEQEWSQNKNTNKNMEMGAETEFLTPTHRYDDIINLPHHASASHPRMPLNDRAAQFAPFAALTGHSTAIRNTAEAVEEEMQLGKDVTLLEDPADPALWAVSDSNGTDE